MSKPEISMDSIMGTVSTLDERLFGENTLSTRLLKSYLFMAVLVFILPPLLDALFHHLGMRALFYYLTLPTLTFLIILVFIYWSITKLVNPIKDMVHALRRIETGDMGVELNMGGYVEIERLKSAVGRMRNSLMIAEKYLGERDSNKDKGILKNILRMHISVLLLVTYILYGVVITSLGSILYAPFVQEFFSILPFHRIILALTMVGAGLGIAAGLGYLTSVMIGKPIRKLAIVAEEASRGNFNAEFPYVMKGELNELSHHLRDITKALEMAYKDLEEETTDTNTMGV